MLAHGVLALCVAVIPAVAAQAATWTYTPELVRLDIDGNELPAGEVGAERDGVLRVGLYVTVSSDGAALADDKGKAETDISMTMLALGSRRELMSVGRIDLAMKADAGDAETGTGAELGAGFAYMHPVGLAIQARGHVLLAHEASEFQQWGGGLTVNFDAGEQGKGLFFAFAPTWGTPSTGAEGMWNGTRATQAVLATGGAPLGMHVDTRVGYGMILSNGGGQLMLFSEVGQPDAGPSHLRFGTQLARLRTNGSQLDLELYGEHINPILDEDPTYGIMLNARGRF